MMFPFGTLVIKSLGSSVILPSASCATAYVRTEKKTQSGFAPDALMTLPHFSTSCAT
jgi:hypothetical protein